MADRPFIADAPIYKAALERENQELRRIHEDVTALTQEVRRLREQPGE